MQSPVKSPNTYRSNIKHGVTNRSTDMSVRDKRFADTRPIAEAAVNWQMLLSLEDQTPIFHERLSEKSPKQKAVSS